MIEWPHCYGPLTRQHIKAGAHGRANHSSPKPGSQEKKEETFPFKDETIPFKGTPSVM